MNQHLDRRRIMLGGAAAILSPGVFGQSHPRRAP